MGRIAIIYSSRHGHVHHIAERLGAIAAMRHMDFVVVNVEAATANTLQRCEAVVIAGSVHFGRHAPALQRFVAQHVRRLSAIPSAFVSVSGAAASLPGRSEAEQYIARFLRLTGWHPDLQLPCAGAVLYTKYGFLTRLMMKFASRTAGRGTDTSRDFVYTNWSLLDQFMHAFVDTVERFEHTAAEIAEPARAATY